MQVDSSLETRKLLRRWTCSLFIARKTIHCSLRVEMLPRSRKQWDTDGDDPTIKKSNLIPYRVLYAPVWIVQPVNLQVQRDSVVSHLLQLHQQVIILCHNSLRPRKRHQMRLKKVIRRAKLSTLMKAKAHLLNRWKKNLWSQVWRRQKLKQKQVRYHWVIQRVKHHPVVSRYLKCLCHPVMKMRFLIHSICRAQVHRPIHHQSKQILLLLSNCAAAKCPATKASGIQWSASVPLLIQLDHNTYLAVEWEEDFSSPWDLFAPAWIPCLSLVSLILLPVSWVTQLYHLHLAPIYWTQTRPVLRWTIRYLNHIYQVTLSTLPPAYANVLFLFAFENRFTFTISHPLVAGQYFWFLLTPYSFKNETFCLSYHYLLN